MQAATATQPSSRQHKHYVPIVAGTLGGCGLLLFLGCLAYLFMRSRRHKYARVTTIQPRDCTNKGDRDGPILTFYEDRTALPSYKPAILHSSASSVWSARAKDYSEDISFCFAEPPSRKKRRTRTASRWDEPLWDTFSTTGSTSINDTGPHQVISNSLPAIRYFCSEGAEDCLLDLPRSVSPGETPLSEWALRNLPSVQGSVSRQSLQHEGPSSSPEFDTDLERGRSVNWDPNSDLSSLVRYHLSISIFQRDLIWIFRTQPHILCRRALVHYRSPMSIFKRTSALIIRTVKNLLCLRVRMWG